MIPLGINPAIFTKHGLAAALCKELFVNLSLRVTEHRKFVRALNEQFNDDLVMLPSDAYKLLAFGVNDLLWEVSDIQDYDLPNIGKVTLMSFRNGYDFSDKFTSVELKDGDRLALFVGKAQFERSCQNYRKLLQFIDYAPTTDAQLTARAQSLGIRAKYRQLYNEYRVAPIAGSQEDREAVASYTSDRDDAWGTALQMSKQIKEDPRFADRS